MISISITCRPNGQDHMCSVSFEHFELWPLTKILGYDSLIRAGKMAGVVVCPRNICHSIPKVDWPLLLKLSRLMVMRLFIRRTCLFKVLFRFRSFSKSICVVWCEDVLLIWIKLCDCSCCVVSGYDFVPIIKDTNGW